MNQKQLDTLKKNNEESHEFTRNCIYAALMVLLSKNKLEDVTITRLCEVAGVSRVAFYRNYKHIEDVLTDKIIEFGHHINSKMGTDVYNNWLALFNEAEKEKDLFDVMIKLGVEHTLYDVFYSLLPKKEETRTVQAIWISLYYCMLIKRFKSKKRIKVEDEARLAYKYTKNIPLVEIENKPI